MQNQTLISGIQPKKEQFAISGLFKKIKNFAVKQQERFTNTSLYPETIEVERSNYEICKFDPNKVITPGILQQFMQDRSCVAKMLEKESEDLVQKVQKNIQRLAQLPGLLNNYIVSMQRQMCEIFVFSKMLF